MDYTSVNTTKLQDLTVTLEINRDVAISRGFSSYGTVSGTINVQRLTQSECSVLIALLNRQGEEAPLNLEGPLLAEIAEFAGSVKHVLRYLVEEAEGAYIEAGETIREVLKARKTGDADFCNYLVEDTKEIDGVTYNIEKFSPGIQYNIDLRSVAEDIETEDLTDLNEVKQALEDWNEERINQQKKKHERRVETRKLITRAALPEEMHEQFDRGLLALEDEFKYLNDHVFADLANCPEPAKGVDMTGVCTCTQKPEDYSSHTRKVTAIPANLYKNYCMLEKIVKQSTYLKLGDIDETWRLCRKCGNEGYKCTVWVKAQIGDWNLTRLIDLDQVKPVSK